MSYIIVINVDVPKAVVALTKGIPKFTEFGMVDATWEAKICKGSFRTTVESPLSPVNKDLHELAVVAVVWWVVAGGKRSPEPYAISTQPSLIHQEPLSSPLSDTLRSVVILQNSGAERR
ncbi:hypothetical protein ACS0TY_033656 [Phlomoides rotata]